MFQCLDLLKRRLKGSNKFLKDFLRAPYVRCGGMYCHVVFAN